MRELNEHTKINWTETELSDLRLQFENVKSFLQKSITKQNFQEAYEQCYFLFSRFPLPLLEVNVKTIIRARKNDKQDNNIILYCNQNEISYNKDFTDRIKLGRFNRPLEPIFYGSIPTISKHANFFMTAASETCKDLLDDSNNDYSFEFTVGCWDVKPFMAICLCFDDKHLAVNNMMLQNIQYFKNNVYQNCSPKSAEFILECLLILSFQFL